MAQYPRGISSFTLCKTLQTLDILVTTAAVDRLSLLTSCRSSGERNDNTFSREHGFLEMRMGA